MREECHIITSDGELYHYGVPGMKWGVRRDAQMLASSRRDKQVREAKNAYKAGKITKDARNEAIRSANLGKKKMLEKTKAQFANAKTDAERRRIENDIRNKATKEVSNVGLKRGAHVVNSIFGAANIASVGVSTAALAAVNPAFAGAAIASAAVGIAAEAGYRYLISKGIDRLK